MRSRPIILLLLCGNFLFAQTRSQNLSHYTIKEGLSNNTVLCIYKDSRGFLWIGTQEGLNRFDGYQFHRYFAEKNNKVGLANDNILDILEYRYGQLLIATTNGIGVLNTLTGQFENDKIKIPALRSGSGTIINSIYKDRQSNIWVNHSGELDLLDSNLAYKYRVTDMDWARPLKGIVVSLEEWQTDSQSRLWLPTDTSGINIIDLKQQKIFNYSHNPERLPWLKKESIRSFALDDANGKLLYAAWGEGLTLYDCKTGAAQQELFGIPGRDENRTINAILKISPGKYLFYIGGDCYETSTTHFASKPVSERSIPLKNNRDVRNTIALFPYDDHQYWVGTTTGLVMFDYQKPFYRELMLQAGNMSDCSDMIIASSGKIYCTFSTNQLVILQKDRQHFSIYTLTAGNTTRMTEICEDRYGRFWIGTTKGIYQFDTLTQKFIPNNFLSIASFPLNCNVLYCDRNGDIWIGTRDPFGLYRYDMSRHQLQKIDNAVTDWFEKQSGGSRISKITEDNEGRLWMSSRTSGAIACYTPGTESWKLFPSKENNFNFMARKGIESMYTGPDGITWLSNYAGDGLIRFEYRNDSLEQFNRNDGLPTNYIRSITPDEAGNLWLGSEYGITKFSINDRRPQLNISYQGFRDADQQAVFDPLTRSLIFSAGNRLVFLPADSNADNMHAPAPIIDKVLVNNETEISAFHKKRMRLAHDQNNITIDFTAPFFSNLSKIRFAYRLSGADNNWRYSDAGRRVQYASLAPGEYSFAIKTIVENGDWGNEYIPFSFTIISPYWQTWWFLTILAALITGSVFFFVRRRIHAIRHEAQLKQQIAETEMKALRAQMNPHFIFNCLNSIDNLIQNGERDRATTYLAKFARLLRAILENSKNNTIPCWKDLETLKLYLELEELRCDKKFSWQLMVDPEISQGDYKVPPMIIQPYVENAIHHGLLNRDSGSRELKIAVKADKNHINYIVEDSGIGRKKAAEYKELNRSAYQSMGLEITRERINLFNRQNNGSVQITDLYNENRQPVGTRVEVHLLNQS